MIGIRIECDFEGCGRHFEDRAVIAPEADLDEVLAVPHVSGHAPRTAPAVYLVGNVLLPKGWATRNDARRMTRVYCADHADT